MLRVSNLLYCRCLSTWIGALWNRVCVFMYDCAYARDHVYHTRMLYLNIICALHMYVIMLCKCLFHVHAHLYVYARADARARVLVRVCVCVCVDSLRGSSVEIGTMQRRLAPAQGWDAHIEKCEHVFQSPSIWQHLLQRPLGWPLRQQQMCVCVCPFRQTFALQSFSRNDLVLWKPICPRVLLLWTSVFFFTHTLYMSMSISISISLFLSISLSLYIYISIYLSIYLPIYLYFHIYLPLPHCLSLSLYM